MARIIVTKNTAERVEVILLGPDAHTLIESIIEFVREWANTGTKQ